MQLKSEAIHNTAGRLPADQQGYRLQPCSTIWLTANLISTIKRPFKRLSGPRPSVTVYREVPTLLTSS
ncbi:hypothetical protein J6590_031253 [Homalodisca vitripennis]|nr:hypothetical protein J6590_031253 [Homalodisca vitripennis]